MVLAHHLYDVITNHRAAKSAIPSMEEVKISGDLESATGNDSVDVETLRTMFEARDIALNKLISATTSLTMSSDTSTSLDSDSPSPATQQDATDLEIELEAIQCVACQEYVSCTFPPLKSAVASHRLQYLENNPTVCDLEPKYTNWTTDYIGYFLLLLSLMLLFIERLIIFLFQQIVSSKLLMSILHQILINRASARVPHLGYFPLMGPILISCGPLIICSSMSPYITNNQFSLRPLFK